MGAACSGKWLLVLAPIMWTLLIMWTQLVTTVGLFLLLRDCLDSMANISASKKLCVAGQAYVWG